jgi:hypothetical protein
MCHPLGSKLKMNETKYDIAISFLHQDEPLATELEKKLSPSLKVFIYSKKQEEIAGTDGLESFRDVFRNQSRLVVILYRDGWGKSKWTRVEEGAITDRFIDEGWQWLLFVSLDSKSTPPKWLPETKIRLNYEDYGLEQCIGAIKARVVELGATIHHESAIDYAKRLDEDNLWEEKRRQFLSSEKGVDSACKEAEIFFAGLEVILTEIKSSTSNMNLEYKRKDSCLVARGRIASLKVYWKLKYLNTLSDSRMLIGQWKGQLLLPDQQGWYFDKPIEYATHLFDPDFTREFGLCWRSSSGKYFTSLQLAEHAANLLVQTLEHVK